MNFDETIAFVAADYISGIQNLAMRPVERASSQGYPYQSTPTHIQKYQDVPWDECVCEPWRKECACGAEEKRAARQGC